MGDSDTFEDNWGYNSQPWDLIISGAGPSGLTAGIISGRAGLHCLIIESGDQPGPQPRGETIHDHPLLAELYGQDILNQIGLYQTKDRKFNSPDAKKTIELQRKTPAFTFKWRAFIDPLWEQAKQAGVEFKFNTQVIKPIIHENICVGVELNNGEQIFGQTVFACDGYQSHLARFVHIPLDEMNCWIVKTIVHDFQNNYSGFEYFFIAGGMLKYAPQFPPAIVFTFPRNDRMCEVGFMLLTNPLQLSKHHWEIPDETELLRVWHELINSYPLFSDLMRNSTVDFEYATQIPMNGIFLPSMLIAGLAIIGDGIGFIEASGASGLLAAMQQASFASHFLIDHYENVSNFKWSQKLLTEFNKQFSQTAIYKHIVKVHSLISRVMAFIFYRLATSKKINQWWWLIKLLYSLS
jgi:flavin-dependent dehydrogenase